MSTKKFLLEEKDIPTAWYNIVADMKNKPLPILNPQSKQPFIVNAASTNANDPKVKIMPPRINPKLASFMPNMNSFLVTHYYSQETVFPVSHLPLQIPTIFHS